MKVTKPLLAVAAAGTLALGTAALSEEGKVEGTKVAPLQTVLPNSYGSVETRYQNSLKTEGDGVWVRKQSDPKWELHPTLGSTFFDGNLDTSFTWIFRKTADTNAVKKVVLYNYSTLSLLKNDYVYATADAYSEQTSGDGDSFNFTTPGLEIGTSQKMDTAIGGFSVGLWAKPYATFTSGRGQDKKTPANETGIQDDKFALNAEGDKEIDQRDPDLGVEQGLMFSLSPNATPGLKVSTGYWRNRDFSPKYETTLVDGDTRTSLNGYEVEDVTTTRFKLSYKINDMWSMYNDTRYYINGFYDAGTADGDTRMINRTGVSASLF